MANLSVDYSVCLDATPRASTTVTKRGQESAVALAFVAFRVRVMKRLSILAGVFTKRASEKTS